MEPPFHLQKFYHFLLQNLKATGNDAPEIEARYILAQRCGLGLNDLIANPDKELEPLACTLMMQDMQQRQSGVPLSRIYGERQFWGLDFYLSPETLDPRPDTETILDVALRRFSKANPPRRILDLGTGSGCILISLLNEFPQAYGLGVDISAGAVQTAQKNAARHGCAARVEFVCGSWLEQVVGEFDLIVSNPPYISNQVIPTLSREVRNHDPILALDGGADGLDAYRIIFASLKKNISKDGVGLFEIGYDQEKSVSRLVEEYGFLLLDIHLDLAGQPRVVEISRGDKCKNSLSQS